MAIGAICEFIGNGISVPEDIAVVGFDDVEENTSLRCSFSTINFPVWEMICAITDRIVSDLSGKTVYAPELIEMQAQFMHRESCGCTSFFEQRSKQSIEFIPLEQPRSSHGSLKRVALFRRSLEDVLEECLASGNISLFNDFMQDAIRVLSHSGNLIGSFIDTFSTQWTVSLLRHTDFNTQTLINSLFVDAFRLLLQKKMQDFSRIHANDLGSLSFYQSCNDLQTRNLSVSGAIEGIGSNISKLGIFSCILVFISRENPDEGEIRLNYRENRHLIIPKENFTKFPIQKLLPSGINSVPGHSAILTLAHNNSVFGYLVLSIADKHFEQFSMIQEVVSHLLDSAMSNDLLSSHIKNLTQRNDVLSRLSVIDEATGLYNRRALYVTGRNMFQQAIDARQASAFIFMDMDGLKKINDSYGHAEGDAAILALATALKKCFRDNDLVVRYGGDEFVVLMINVQETVVQKALLRVTAEFESLNASKQHPWTLAASWGYVFNAENVQPDTFESIIEQSDARLYEEKRKRKGGASSSPL
jgi:diguanylate cyclase (GGDEF)-like protein